MKRADPPRLSGCAHPVEMMATAIAKPFIEPALLARVREVLEAAKW
jgi:hypothetical protein